MDKKMDKKNQKKIKKNNILKDIIVFNVLITVFLSTLISLSITKWKFYLKLESDTQGIQNQNIDYVDQLINDSNTQNSQNQNSPYIIYKPVATNNCITPRWVELKDSESTIAYQQRSDVNTLCNVQRRVCENGKLSWTFKQKKCMEHIVYEYVKQEAICYNCKPDNPYIQPENLAPNRRWDFNMDGKINQPLRQITKRDNTINTEYVGSQSDIWQNWTTKSDCITPRSTTIKHWFFTRAYKSSDWFINSPCIVEIRYCTDWTLNGQYNYESCNYHDITYEDYVKNSSDSVSIMQQLINMLK